MTNRTKNFNTGYKQGFEGVPFNITLDQFPGYADGWDAGNCDRPTLDELLPLDVAKERSTGCLS